MAAGIILPLSVLDPYAISGRFLSTLLKPFVTAGNNQLLSWVGEGRWDALYQVSYSIPAWPVTILAGFMLLGLGLGVWLWGRIYCNSLCPVGAFLSLLSRFSCYKLEFAPAECRHCRQCLNSCKAGCIDAETRHLDFDRCVLCFDCATACKFNGLRWVRRWRGPRHLDLPLRSPTPTHEETEPRCPDRRSFLAAAGTLAVGAAVVPVLAAERNAARPVFPIMPPGAGDFNRLASRCVGCQLCVETCPSKVIRPAVLQYGAAGFMLPRLDFHANMCEFDCTACSNACPSGALQPLTVERKHLAQIGRVRYQEKLCVITQEHVDCGACAEHCPTGAVAMKPWQDGLRIPVVDVSTCIGCGCCEHVCPVRPQRAIVVDGLRQQAVALPPPKTKSTAPKDTGFPF